MLFYAAVGLALVNLLTWTAFALDKRSAIRGGRRVPERSLLWLAALGGSPAALVARQMLRHKTRKQPFGAVLLAIVCLQVLVLCVLLAIAGERLDLPVL